MIKLVPFTALILFFLVLAERITLEAVLIGVAVSFLALKASNQRSEVSSSVVSPLPLYSIKLWPCWMKFILILIKEIVLAALQVSAIVLSSKMPIKPTVCHYNTRIRDERLIVILSNSITLTPGTMTVDLHNDELTVHVLTEKHYIDLLTNPVEKILLRMEEKLYG